MEIKSKYPVFNILLTVHVMQKIIHITNIFTVNIGHNGNKLKINSSYSVTLTLTVIVHITINNILATRKRLHF